MTARARKALQVIQACIESQRYALTIHFSLRMQQRGLFWPDVETVIDRPMEVRSGGVDIYDRAKWIIQGRAADTDEIEVVCAIEVDESGTEFITIYWN